MAGRSSSNPTRLGPLIGVAAVLILLAAGGIFLAVTDFSEPTEPEPLPSFEPPELTPTRFLNTGSDATYVGNQACAECHREQFASYERTAHSRALSPVDPAVEPEGGEFYHAASQRHYRIYRDDGQLRQTESMKDDQGTIVEQDYAMDWLIGSGRHSRSYLVEIDGFLVESPVTWYSSREQWSVSPGYDVPNHWGFERAADEGCVFCHVGLAVPTGESLSQLDIQQQAISCERCHGPGSLHVAQRKSGAPLASEQGDPTIVHPGRLDRMRAEDICAQCHLRGDATVTVRGRRLTDYRPGMPLTDIRVDYLLAAENRPMKVVGHVDQMRSSPCWKAEGSTLTCTTCHDPHQDAPPENAIAFYRDKCLSCHASESCGLPTTAPRRVAADDNCAQCHMPQVETDIPHIAFTHHRIGIHEEDAQPRFEPRETELVPAAPIDHLPEIDRERCLGMGYLELSAKQENPEAAQEFRRRAIRILKSVYEQGLNDGDTAADMARLIWEEEPEQAVMPAQLALHAPTLSPQSQLNAFFILADAAFRAGEFEAAVETLNRLTKLRRHSQDHFLLAISKAELGELDEAIEHGEKAAEIHPFRLEIYQFLADANEMAGRSDNAAHYERLVQRLQGVSKTETSSVNPPPAGRSERPPENPAIPESGDKRDGSNGS